MSSNPSFVGTVRTPCAQIANGDATGFKTLMAAGANGSRVDLLGVTNSDAANPYVLQLAIQKGGTDYVIGEVTVPTGAGTNGTAKAVNLLNSADLPQVDNTVQVLYLESGATLRARSKTTVSGVNTLNIVGNGGDY
jgi:hypothetical protein